MNVTSAQPTPGDNTKRRQEILMFVTRCVGLLVVATATACSGQQEAAPPATPAATEAPIPDTASPFDALPESVRLVMDKPFTATSMRWSSVARFAWP